jgi:hypothetical protein
MDPKPRPNHQRYLAILRAMTPEQRLLKSFELTALSRQLLKDGLRNRHPHASESELHQLYLARLKKCHSKTSSSTPSAPSKPPESPT